MSVFENLIIIKDGEIVYNQWIEWNHFGIPNKPEWLRELMRDLAAFLGHCLRCTALDGCYLVESNMPEQPIHIRCHCGKKNISTVLVNAKAIAECDIKKFTEYIFKDDKKSKGKNKIFYDLGFNIEDSEFLKNEYKKQALIQYLMGEYNLMNLDEYGQRLAIPISLRGKTFYSGWLLLPEGRIKNTTPFGCWIN